MYVCINVCVCVCVLSCHYVCMCVFTPTCKNLILFMWMYKPASFLSQLLVRNTDSTNGSTKNHRCPCNLQFPKTRQNKDFSSKFSCWQVKFLFKYTEWKLFSSVKNMVWVTVIEDRNILLYGVEKLQKIQLFNAVRHHSCGLDVFALIDAFHQVYFGIITFNARFYINSLNFCYFFPDFTFQRVRVQTKNTE